MQEEKMEDQIENKAEIRISVRNLVEFLLRSGDLDNRRSGADKEAMQKGSRIHRKLQGRMGSNYEAEVSLKYLAEREKFRIVVEGRADGILTEKDRVIIDEIKAVYKETALMTEPVPVHLAQAKCYAFIYADREELEEAAVRMTYVQMETEQIKYFYENYSKQELERWFLGLIQEYEKWASFQVEWVRERTASIEKIHFPFSYRSQQKELVSGVYRTIEQGKRLFLQASTGAGKTISTVYPAVQALGKGMADKIFYLTAKTVTRAAALDCLKLLAEQGLEFKAVVLTAKEKICFCEEVKCNPQACSYAEGHFDRINDCMFQMLQAENLITREVVEQYAREWRVCPFELSLDMSNFMDGIICDYNYAFDYDVCLKRFFGEGNKEEFIFLIDEAHNLVERGRSMYSASLYKEEFLEIKRKVKYYSRKLEKLLEKCNRKMLEWKKACSGYEKMSPSDAGELTILLIKLMAEMDEFLEEEEEEDIKTELLDFYFKVRHFINIYACVDENYVIYREFCQNSFKVKLFCVNPSSNLENFLEKSRSAIFFSATLLPVRYYMKLLAGSPEDFAMYAQSSFQKKNRLVLAGTDVTSRYRRRNEREYQKIADYIEAVIQAKTGNYILFFPSYAYLQQVYDIFLERQADVRIIKQDIHMTEEERQDFLKEFQKNETTGLAAFCVLGGIFSEGIDLKQEQLIGSIVVGTGMPQIGTEQELLQEYFQETLGRGFDYAFRYPGFHKVLQASGRVIRTEEDRGVILLLEERLLEREYQELFPREWEDIQICNRTNVRYKIEDFWRKQGD